MRSQYPIDTRRCSTLRFGGIVTEWERRWMRDGVDWREGRDNSSISDYAGGICYSEVWWRVNDVFMASHGHFCVGNLASSQPMKKKKTWNRKAGPPTYPGEPIIWGCCYWLLLLVVIGLFRSQFLRIFVKQVANMFKGFKDPQTMLMNLWSSFYPTPCTCIVQDVRARERSPIKKQDSIFPWPKIKSFD